MSSSPGLLDRIAEFLESRPYGVPATEIARRFLRMRDPSPRGAGPLIEALLKDDRRFRTIGTQIWVADPLAAGSPGAGPDNGLLFGVARPLPNTPDTIRYALLRMDGEREEDVADFVRRRGDRSPLTPEAARVAGGARLVLYSSASHFGILRKKGGRSLVEPPPLRMRESLADLFPREVLRSPERLAARREIRYEEGESPLHEARLLARIYSLFEGQILRGPSGRETRKPGEKIPFLREGGSERIRSLPEEPGIYRMEDEEGRLLYIGKSGSLRSRVESYFTGYDRLSDRKKTMVRRIARIETKRFGSEIEALIEEWRAIRKRRPPYNEQVDVQESPSDRFIRGNAVLFLPSTDPRCVVLFAIRPDGALLRLTARRNAVRMGRLRSSLERFFSGEPAMDERGAQVLLDRWIRANREEITVLDADRYPDMDDLVRVVRECLCDPDITAGVRSDPV